jgi:hypothetical protein
MRYSKKVIIAITLSIGVIVAFFINKRRGN